MTRAFVPKAVSSRHQQMQQHMTRHTRACVRNVNRGLPLHQQMRNGTAHDETFNVETSMKTPKARTRTCSNDEGDEGTRHREG